MRKDFVGFLLLLLALLLIGFGLPRPHYYRQHPFQITVVDEETGLPIEGAVAVARWTIRGGLYNVGALGILDVQEGISDESGEINFKGFDKYWRPWFRIRGDFLSVQEPSLIVYKYEYKPVLSGNSRAPHQGLSRYHNAEIYWNSPDKILLKKTLQEPRNRAKEFMQRLNNPVRDLVPEMSSGCAWVNLKHFILEFDKQMQEVEKFGLYYNGYDTWYKKSNEYYKGLSTNKAREKDGKCENGILWIEKSRSENMHEVDEE